MEGDLYPEDLGFVCEVCDCYDGFHGDGPECTCECCCGEITCAFGYAADEPCGAESRYGIEYCEFECPFNRLG